MQGMLDREAAAATTATRPTSRLSDDSINTSHLTYKFNGFLYSDIKLHQESHTLHISLPNSQYVVI